MASKFDIILQREHILAHFRPTLSWYSSKAIVASEVEKKYKEWQTMADGRIVLFSPEDKKALEVLTDNLFFVSESTENRDGIADVSQILYKATKDYSVAVIRRVLYQQILVLKSPISITELTDLLHKKLFKEGITNIQGGKLSDLAYILDTKEGDMKIHIQLGAVKHDESLKLFQSRFEKDIKLESDSNLYIDVQISMENEELLSKSNIKENLGTFQKRSEQVLHAYLEYLSN